MLTESEKSVHTFMDIDKLELLRNVVGSYSVHMQIYREEDQDPSAFDEGLRRLLYQDYDYSFLMEQIRRNCRKRKVYETQDIFALHYTIFRLDTSDMESGGQISKNDVHHTETGVNHSRHIIIGPYFVGQEEPDAVAVAEEAGLELYQTEILRDYYYGVPTARNLEHVVCAMLNMMYAQMDWQIEKTGMSLKEPQSGLFSLQPQTDSELSMKMVEERYRYENEMLEAVAQGDVDNVEKTMGRLMKYHVEGHSDNNLRNAKNSMLTMNVLFRKAAENGGVHPYYIDKLSSAIGRKIEAAGSILDIVKINRDFARKYCLLVQRYSLKQYSPLIRDCLNYIDFHLSEELNLNILSKTLSVNASALSRKFRKEMGMTLTDYINRKRVESSLILLATTSLPIGEVGARVGYFNENYYSRIFKEKQGMTPREYREIMTGGQKE